MHLDSNTNTNSVKDESDESFFPQWKHQNRSCFEENIRIQFQTYPCLFID